jgi:hypothetical protein
MVRGAAEGGRGERRSRHHGAVALQNVGVAIGPTSQHGWHAQSYWKSPEGVRWLDNLGHGCQVGQREPFAPMQYFDVSGFMKNQFPEFK